MLQEHDCWIQASASNLQGFNCWDPESQVVITQVVPTCHHGCQANSPKRAQQLVQILTDLGPTFIKIGQVRILELGEPRCRERGKQW